MRLHKSFLCVLVVGSLFALSAGAAELLSPLAKKKSKLKADLEGFGEVPVNSTTATGDIELTVNHAGTAIDYVLTYSDLQGNALQAHIHIGQPDVNGGIMVFLCSNLGNGPAGTPACPTPSGTVSGTLTAAQVIGPAGQGIAPGEFEEMLNVLRTGNSYANVHSSLFPAGEIRGQLK